jgi:hypothetical protein
MKMNRSALLSLILLVLAASLYRAWPERPFGFAPQWAMAIFAGAVIKDKRFAFLFPLISMFISDTLYQLLFMNGQSPIWGFYEGQLTNYILFGLLVMFGFMIKTINWKKIIFPAIAAPTAFFLASNFLVWTAGAGYSRPKTFGGLIQSYVDGIPFYQMSLLATLLFSAVLFGCYYLLTEKESGIAENKA